MNDLRLTLYFPLILEKNIIQYNYSTLMIVYSQSTVWLIFNYYLFCAEYCVNYMTDYVLLYTSPFAIYAYMHIFSCFFLPIGVI